jgi:hypothetical protein
MTKRPSIIGSLTLAEPATEQVTAPPQAGARKPRPDIVHTSVYLPALVHRKLREIAFTTDQKVHDIIMEGIDAALRQYGHPSVADLKAKGKRKAR